MVTETRNLIVEVTSDCNLNCHYCYSHGSHKTDKRAIIKTLNGIVARYRIGNLTITGGEPLLAYDTVRGILRALEGRTTGATVITNGLLLTQPRVDELKSLGASIRISIDGLGDSEKKPTNDMMRIVTRNLNYLNKVSKVITQDNLHSLWDDYMCLVDMGFTDIDIIPQMFVPWNTKGIERIISGSVRIVRHSLSSGIRNSLVDMVEKKERYHGCRNIRILPDGDLSLCLSMNSSGKHEFVRIEELDSFDDFVKNSVDLALRNLRKREWFSESMLEHLCMVDLFYYSHINRKDDTLIQSATRLVSGLHDAIIEELKR